MASNSTECDIKKDCRRPKRPDMKLYVPPRAPRSNASDSSQEHLNEDNSFPVRCKTASLEKLRDVSRGGKQSDSAEDSWDSLFDENGDCINSDLSSTFTKQLRVSNDSNHSPATTPLRPKSSLGHSSCSSSSSSSNSSCQPTTKSSLSATRLNNLTSDSFSESNSFEHILELVTIGASRLSTADIRLALMNCHNHDYDVIWVDDTKALLVFSNKSKADEAFRLSYPNIKLKRLSQATAESRSKASVLAPKPFKKRPETSAVLARRLVSGALGLKVSISPEQRAAESKKLQDARDRKRNLSRQTKDVWEGNVN